MDSSSPPVHTKIDFPSSSAFDATGLDASMYPKVRKNSRTTGILKTTVAARPVNGAKEGKGVLLLLLFVDEDPDTKPGN